jgi:hypothetical protein
MSTFHEAVEQLEALAGPHEEPAVSLCLGEWVGVREREELRRPKRRLYALTNPTEPAQEAP